MHTQECHYFLWCIILLSNKYIIILYMNETEYNKDQMNLMSREHINMRFILQTPSGFPRYLPPFTNQCFKYFLKKHFIHVYNSTHLTTLNVPIIFICKLLL